MDICRSSSRKSESGIQRQCGFRCDHRYQTRRACERRWSNISVSQVSLGLVRLTACFQSSSDENTHHLPGNWRAPQRSRTICTAALHFQTSWYGRYAGISGAYVCPNTLPFSSDRPKARYGASKSGSSERFGKETRAGEIFNPGLAGTALQHNEHVSRAK